MEDITALQDGKIGKGLKKFLSDEVIDKGKGKESLLVIDPKLGSSCVLICHVHTKSNTRLFQPKASPKNSALVSVFLMTRHSTVTYGEVSVIKSQLC